MHFLKLPLQAPISNTLKQFVGKLPTNCLSVFDHFVVLALKGLKNTRVLISFTQRLFLRIPFLFASIMFKVNVKGIQNSIFGRYCNDFHFSLFFFFVIFTKMTESFFHISLLNETCSKLSNTQQKSIIRMLFWCIFGKFERGFFNIRSHSVFPKKRSSRTKSVCFFCVVNINYKHKKQGSKDLRVKFKDELCLTLS